jgi:hypothetical protein
MKNVTISMDEEIAAWARVEAARAGQILSSWVGGQPATLKGGRSSFETDLIAAEHASLADERRRARLQPGSKL